MTYGPAIRFSKRFVMRIAGISVLIAIMLGIAALDPSLAKSKTGKGRDELPPGDFYTMKPFTLPLMKDGLVTDHYTLLVVLELSDPDKRRAVYYIAPRLRDAMYQRLYQMVTFRRKGSQLPPIGVFKRILSKIALDLAGTELVKSLLIQQAFKRGLR